MPSIPRPHTLRDAAAQIAEAARPIFGPAAPPVPQSLSPRAQEVHLLARQQGTIAIPTLYQGQDNSPSPGAVVGIVLGSVAAFILLIWLFATITGRTQTAFVTEEVVSSRRRSRSPPRSSRRSRRSETTSRQTGQRRVIQERIIRDTSRAPAGRTYVEEEVIRGPSAGGNMVEVVEEGESSIVTAPRRNRRGSRR